MNNRLKSGLIVLGLSVVAVPTLVAARSHYTGRVPASIALAPVPTVPNVMAITPAHTVRAAAHKRSSQKLASHKKAAAKVVAKHAATRKAHRKLSHKKTAG